MWQKIPLHIHYAATLPHKIWNSEYTVYATNCSCIWIAYAAIPWSYSESLADKDRPVPHWRSGALLQFFHVLDLVLVNVVLRLDESSTPHSDRCDSDLNCWMATDSAEWSFGVICFNRSTDSPARCAKAQSCFEVKFSDCLRQVV